MCHCVTIPVIGPLLSFGNVHFMLVFSLTFVNEFNSTEIFFSLNYSKI